MGLPLERLPAWIAGPLFAVIGIALLAWPSPRIDGRPLWNGALFLLTGIAIVAIDLHARRGKAAWRAVVERLRAHDPLVQWSSARSRHGPSRLGEAGFSEAGPREDLAFEDVDAVVVLGDCAHDGRAYHCDLVALRKSLRALRGVDVQAAAPGDMPPALAGVPALRIRIRPWPRWLERLELTDEEKIAIERRRHS